ncbi:HEAT repeat domain-containing protein, partial [Chloroflexota bacterium]
TGILVEPIEIIKEIGTEEEDKTKDFDYEFKWKPVKGEEEDAEAEIIKRYKEVTRNGRARKVNASKFRWCINRFSALRSDKALNFMLSRLAELPFLADLAFKYLGLFARRKDVKNKIVSFLSSQDNIYEWQEVWLLLILSKAYKLDSKHLAQIRDIIKNKDKHWASRLAAILVLGKLGDSADRNWLKGLYSAESNPQIKRAIVVGLHN